MPVRVHIEFKRVQTYLFAVPRLRAMVGANALLGNVLRNRLVSTAVDCGAQALPVQSFATYAGDPLSTGVGADTPGALWRLGIIACDGGNFVAVFATRTGADVFTRRAEQLLGTALPGLRFEIHASEVGQLRAHAARTSRAEAVVDLPQFQVCQESGNGPAAMQSRGPEQRWVTRDVETRRREGAHVMRAVQNKAGREARHDIISLLADRLPLHTAGQAPRDLDGLVQGGYMAVIHADGNNIGDRAGKLARRRTDDPTDPVAAELASEGRRQRFFHGARALVRQATVAALNDTFAEYKGRVRPYQLLMVGGDDLLMVCQARYALHFVHHYAQRLDTLSRATPLDDNLPLTVKTGVVISQSGIPFHRLHELAEELASSAKRLFTALADRPADQAKHASVVDWLVTTDSWVDDPLKRRKNELRLRLGAMDLALTQRPVRVLGDDLDSLQGLLTAANEMSEKIAERGGAARSQLRHMATALRSGRHAAELAFAELPTPTRNQLVKSGITRTDGTDAPWRKVGDGRYITALADLIEIVEITRLGRQDLRGRSAPSGARMSVAAGVSTR